MTTTGYSLTSDDAKPNEDWWIASDDLVIVLDGATIRTDTGCVHGLPWYVHRLGAALFSAAQNRDATLPEAIEYAIGHVAEQHRDTCDLAHPGTPSAAVGIVRHTDDHAEWAILGDITVLVDTTTDGVRVTSDNRVSLTATAERRECDQHLLGTEAKMAAIQAMKPHELAARNVDGGYWIASVVPEAARHAYTGSALLTEVQQYAVCSDGAMRAVDLGVVERPEGVLTVLRHGGPSMLIDQVRHAERRDALGRRVPRNKATDDATAVYVDQTVPPAQEASGVARGEAIAEVAGRFQSGLYGAIPAVDGRVYA